jgi:hypothetical protein
MQLLLQRVGVPKSAYWTPVRCEASSSVAQALELVHVSTNVLVLR